MWPSRLVEGVKPQEPIKSVQITTDQVPARVQDRGMHWCHPDLCHPAYCHPDWCHPGWYHRNPYWFHPGWYHRNPDWCHHDRCHSVWLSPWPVSPRLGLLIGTTMIGVIWLVWLVSLSKFHSAVIVLSPLSRLNLDAEWMSDSSVLSKAFSHLDIEPTIDMSASRINKQLSCYISYRPDAEAYAVDAFLVSWKGFYFYAFPPFSLIPRVLQNSLYLSPGRPKSGGPLQQLWRLGIERIRTKTRKLYFVKNCSLGAITETCLTTSPCKAPDD